MPILFPNFLADPAQYHDAEAKWREGWESLTLAQGVREEWQVPWINNVFVDGTPNLDGNPIFSAVCQERNLAIRVIQEDPTNYGQERSFWLDTFPGTGNEPIRELVISCVLTDENFYETIDLMTQWVKTGEVSLGVGESTSQLRPIVNPRRGFLRRRRSAYSAA